MKKVLPLILSLVLALTLTLVAASPVFACTSTMLTITALPEQVEAGQNVQLTISELNDGTHDITGAYVDVFKNGVFWQKLDTTSLSFTGDDTTGPTVLNAGETWTWLVTDAPTANTTYLATGHGFFAGYDITYPDYPNEQDAVTVTVTPPPPTPSTLLTITALPTNVEAGQAVDLTIREKNDGQPGTDLTGAYVYLQPLAMTLNSGSNPPGVNFSGDDADGILEVGETWQWIVNDVVVTDNTTFIATGHGWYDGTEVTWPGDPQEQASVTVTVTPPSGGPGYTPGWWKNLRQRSDAWLATGYATTDKFDTVFGVTNSVKPGTLTLLEAVNTGGGDERALIRHGTAALLNAAYPSINYFYSEAQVIAIVQNAYATGDFNTAKNMLEQYNEW